MNIMMPNTFDKVSNSETYTEHFLFLDSLYRSHGSNVDYISTFNGVNTNTNSNMSISCGEFKNVSSIELKALSIANIVNEPYIILDIKELNGRMHSNVPLADQAFAIIYFDRVEGTSFTKPIRGTDMDTKIVKFNPPLASLNRLTIKFLNSNGDAIDVSTRNTLLFKITTQNI